MASTKHFSQDRTALLLISGNSFLLLLAVIPVLLKLNAMRGTVNYIVSYRAVSSIDPYATGTIWDVISFIVAAVVFYAIGMVLGYKVHAVKRELALLVLTLTLPLLGFLIVVSNALLVLR
jgi:hypothetical protein